MGQGSAGYFEEDEEDDAQQALPMRSDDRASTDLQSPDFQLPAEEPEPAPADIPAPQPVGNTVLPSEPAPVLHQRRVGDKAEQRIQIQSQRLELQQQREHDKQLKQAGVVGRNPDGTPAFKSAAGAPQQTDDGRWTRDVRDEQGNVARYDMRDPALAQSKRMRVDRSTGDTYFEQGGLRITTGKDQPTVDRLNLLTERKRLQAENANDNAQLAAERDLLNESKKALKAFGSTPTQYETQMRNLEQAIAGKPADAPEVKRYREVADAWAKWQRENPDYRKARSQFDAADANVSSREKAVQDRRIRAAALMGNGTGAAIAGSMGEVGIQPIIRGQDADAKSLAAWATLKGVESNIPPASSHLYAVQGLAQRGIKTIGGRPIAEVEAELKVKADAENAPKPEPTEKKFLSNMANSVQRGWMQFQLSRAMDDNDPTKVAGIMQQLAKMPESEASQRWSKGDYNLEALPEMFVSSMAAYLPTWITKLPKYVGAGALIGAGIGSVAGGVGAVPGGVTGAGIGAMRGATGAASFALESSGKMIDALAERGVNITDPAALKAAFENPELMDEVRMLGIKKGLPIAVVDSATAGIGARFMGPGKSALGKLFGAIKGAAVEGLAGGGGELLGQKVAGEKTDIPSAAAEAAVEFVGVGETVLSLAIEKAKLWSGVNNPATQQHAANSFSQINAELDDALAKANTARESGDLAGHADRMAEVNNLLSGAHEVASATSRLVPDNARKALSKAADAGADFEAEQTLLDSDPATYFATAEIGRGLREVYGDPATVERAIQMTGVNPEVGETIADQHRAFAAARDLQKVLEGQRLAPEREQALAALGLLDVAEDGTVSVTDDSLPILPTSTRESLKANPDAFGPLFQVTPDATGNGWTSLVTAGRQRIGQTIIAGQSTLSPTGEGTGEPLPTGEQAAPIGAVGEGNEPSDLDAIVPDEQRQASGLSDTERQTVAEFVGQFKARGVFKNVEWRRDEARGSGGVAVGNKGETFVVIEQDLAATLAAIPEERREAKLRAMLDEELRHVADVRANTDEQTADLWNSLPKTVQDSTQAIYTRERADDEFSAKMGPVQWGREFKRLLSQELETGEPSELMEITAAELQAAKASGESVTWAAKILAHLRRMLTWLTDAKAGETGRQLGAIRDELDRILSPAAAPAAETKVESKAIAESKPTVVTVRTLNAEMEIVEAKQEATPELLRDLSRLMGQYKLVLDCLGRAT